MSRPIVLSSGTSLSDTCSVESSDCEVDIPGVDSRSDETSSASSHGDSNPAKTTPAPVLASRTATPTARADAAALAIGWPALSGLRGLMEYAWHAPAKVVNAGAFTLLAAVPATPMRYVAASLAGVAAGYCTYRLIVSRTGDGPCSKALAAAAGLVAGGAASVATAQGSGYPGLMTAAASVLGSFTSHVVHHSERAEEPTAAAKWLGPGLVVVTLGGSIAVSFALPSLRVLDLGRLHRRTLAVLAESATIELLKAPVERAMPAADQRAARFERKLKMALIGVLPYALCSIVFNGLVGNLLRSEMRSDRFESYLAPVLTGALASVAKGAVNAAIIASGGLPSVCGDRTARHVRPAEDALFPPPGITLEKIALRFTIAHARDVIYLSLVDSGVPETGAACLAFGLYAFFAQHRDLLFDMMQGEGWSEPQHHSRTAVSSA